MASKKNTIVKSGYDVLSLGDNTAAAKIRDVFNVLAHLPTGPPTLLTVQETARLLRCSASSLNKWRLIGRGPHFVYVGSRVRYRPTDIAEYINKQIRASTSAEQSPTAA